MSAALIDLVAKGAQDAYITGDPQVSFFRQNYKRHTNFAIKPERMDYIGTFGGGNEVMIPVRSKGDLLSYVWVEAPNIANVLVNNNGFFSADTLDTTEFSLVIGGQEVCKLDALFIQGVHNILYKDNSSKTSCTVTTAEISDNAKASTVTGAGSDYYMIPFFFSEDWTKSLPLVALQYHAVEIRIKCRSGFTPAATPKVFGTYVYLDTEERQRAVENDHELLITQVQYQPMNHTDIDIDLTYYNHPVKAVHLVSSGVNGTSWADQYTFDTATMYINGNPLFEDMSSTYHHNVVPEMHTTNLPTSVIDSAPLYTWPLCLNINKSQPSGTLNFSRIDNAKLSLKNPTGGASNITRAYAVNYNILKIKNGMAGVAFGN
jgi:hypothetical protein